MKWSPLLLLAACTETEVKGLQPELTVAPESVVFEGVALGAEGEALVTIGNAGRGTLLLESFSTASPFSIESVPLDLEPGATLGVSVRLHALADGTHGGALRIESNDPSQPSYDLPLTAVVAAPDILVEPDRLVFSADGTARAQRLYVGNEGEGPLVITSVFLSDDGGGVFSIGDGWEGRRLESGDVEPLELSCQAEAVAMGALTILSNDPDTPLTEIWLGAEDPGNEHPTAPVVDILPERPEAGEGLVCEILEPAADPEGEQVSYTFSWERDGSAWTGATATTAHAGDSIAEGETDDLDLWTCEVTPSDPWGEGEPGSALVLVGCQYGADERCPGVTCLEILQQGFSSGDGTYWIDPLGVGAYEVYCDMSLDGGGWTLALVSSSDGQDSWTWDGRANLTSDITPFGSLEALDHDLKSAAHHDLVIEDLLFLHQPSGVWAAYGGVGDGSGSFADLIQAAGGPTCYSLGEGHIMTAGTLVLQESLCSTELFINVQDRDGGACGSGNGQHGWGPAWSGGNNNGCPFDDPAGSGLGPDISNPSIEIDSTYVLDDPELGVPGHGFGHAARLNTGTPGAAENYLQAYVR